MGRCFRQVTLNDMQLRRQCFRYQEKRKLPNCDYDSLEIGQNVARRLGAQFRAGDRGGFVEFL